MTDSPDLDNYPVVEGYLLTPEFLAQTHIYSGILYHRHPNGGGWVAETSYVPDNLRVTPSVRIGPNTRLVDDKNLAGQTHISGDVYLDSLGKQTPISRSMRPVDRLMLNERISRPMRDDMYSHVSR